MTKNQDLELELEQVKNQLETYKRQYDKLTLEFSKTPSEEKYEALGEITRYIVILNNRIEELEEEIKHCKELEKRKTKYIVKYKGKIIDTIELKNSLDSYSPILTIVNEVSDNINIEPATK